LKIIFFGSSGFSVPFLEEVKNSVTLVITSRDKRKNRGRKLLPNPVKEAAIRFGIDYFAGDSFDEEIIEEIRNISPDFFVVVSYGKIIPSELLSIPRYAINVHPSKLPLYRGAAPIERQILDGVTHSAVSIIEVDKRLDRGNIFLEKPFDIAFTDTKEDLEKKIINIGRKLLKKAIEALNERDYKGEAQVGKSSYAKKIMKEDEIINWDTSAAQIYNKIRALYPLPSAQTIFRGKILKIFKGKIINDVEKNVKTGEIVYLSKNSFFVSCGKGILEILEVQLEGKKRISAKDFINGAHIKLGETFGE